MSCACAIEENKPLIQAWKSVARIYRLHVTHLMGSLINSQQIVYAATVGV